MKIEMLIVVVTIVGMASARHLTKPPPQQSQQQQFQPKPPTQESQQQQFQPQPQTQESQQQQFQPKQFQPQPHGQPAPQPIPVLRGGTSKCPAHAPNHFWTDPRDNKLRGYVVTWKLDAINPGCRNMQQSEARAYCESMGMKPVSLDSPDKQYEFNKLLASAGLMYFWTGGIVDHANKKVFWANSRAAVVSFASQHSGSQHWSHTGGAKLPQPDNRAFGENGIPESCLAVLNNWYADGIKWHDVACHHKKPTVCEPAN